MYDLNGNLLDKFDSTRSAARFLNVQHSNISKCCNKKHNKKNGKPIIVKGYTFRYLNDIF